MTSIAIIPARGGSRRIQRKNIRNFCGKPIIAYSIKTAFSSGLFERIVVSTDDKEIARVSRRYGAETPFLRPSELADDFTGTSAVVRHALQWLEDRQESFEHACCIYATAPFITPESLKKGFKKLKETNSSYVFSVTAFESPPQKALLINENGEIEPFSPEYISSRSQDLTVAYHDAGQFYWGKAEEYLHGKAPLSAKRSFPLILPGHLVKDIDTIDDWRHAELMYKALQAEGGSGK